MILALINKLINFFLKHYCLVCCEQSNQEKPLCIGCEINLPWYKNLENSSTILFSYTKPINQWITGLKYNHKLIYAHLLGHLFSENLLKIRPMNSLPQLIIPIPLHKKRLRERGFNQALEISKIIAKSLNISTDMQSIIRIKNTAAQTLLPSKKRKANLKNAFALRKKLLNVRHVALLDDVMTTGSTINECYRVLKDAGIERIEVWCIARSSLN